MVTAAQPPSQPRPEGIQVTGSSSPRSSHLAGLPDAGCSSAVVTLKQKASCASSWVGVTTIRGYSPKPPGPVRPRYGILGSFA